MILIRNLKLPLETDFGNLKSVLCRKLGIPLGQASVGLYKKSIDARDKTNICFNCTFTVVVNNQPALLAKLKGFDAVAFEESVYTLPYAGNRKARPVVIGFGPAGMFAALGLAKSGLCPVVLEQGCDADTRKADVDKFFAGGKLKENSNVQFGEGGAGTFSDGKLNTGIKDLRIRAVLKILADHGAGEKILYDAKPHIGTDVLIKVVKSIRQEILSLGGEVLFEHKVTAIKEHNGNLSEVCANTPDGRVSINCERVILAPGHSARDTFIMLKSNHIEMEPKPFAVGVRIEHLQSFINQAQYGNFAHHPALGSADYRLAAHLENGRGVFSFCMCPGGEVVNASSEPNGIAVNGMSNSKRDGKNANAAILVGVDVADYYKNDVLDGMFFQREIEQKAFCAGNGLPVAQTLGSFLGKSSNMPGRVKSSVRTGVTMGCIDNLFPPFITSSLKQGILLFDRKIKGFVSPDALLTAPETRSSSPVRILRNQNGMASLKGLFPCGEGAGYAGGITSAAVDGLKAAEKVIASLT